MAKRRVVKKTAQAGKKSAKTPPRVYSASGLAAQIANQVTWRLKGELKRAQIGFLRIGGLLARVRDEKLYAALDHPDIEDYAQKRLNLGRASLYRYLQVQAWTREHHPEWLLPKPKGFIPDLSDIADLIWIENELNRTDLEASKRVQLEELRQKALAGELLRSELRKMRQPPNVSQTSLKSLISKLRLLRKRAKELAHCPPEALEHLEAAIEILSNDSVLKVAGLETPIIQQEKKWRQFSYA